MKILNKTSYTTTILEVEHNNEVYTIRHAEDHDGYFVNEWEIFDEDGDMLEIEDELCDTLTLLATEHINGTAVTNTINVYSPNAQAEEWASILANELSGEQLDPQEFVDYVDDYHDNPEEYNIHPNSSYWMAIMAAWEEPEKMYKLYSSQFKK